MFVLNKDRIVAWPVTIRVPSDGGTFEEQSFTARFKLLGQERLDALRENADATDQSLLAEALVGWEGVARDGGGEIPCSAEAKRELLGVPYVRLGVLAAYLECSTGAKRKN